MSADLAQQAIDTLVALVEAGILAPCASDGPTTQQLKADAIELVAALYEAGEGA